MANDSLFDTNAEQVGDWFEDQADEFEDDVQKMLDEVTEKTHQAALEKVPVDTGRLKESLEKDGHSVGTDVPYGSHVGLGTIYMSGTDYLWGPAEDELKKALNSLANG